MAPELLSQFDEAIAAQGYANRSEAIRDIVRDYLVERRWELGAEEVIGTITIVYDHHAHDISEQLTELQHHHHPSIISTLHVHLDENHCLEVLVVKGSADEVHRLAGRVISTRGVKHGKLVCTTTARGLG